MDHLQFIFVCDILSYLCLVSFMINNICVWYLWYTMFIYGVHAVQYYCLQVSMIQLIYTVNINIHNIYGRYTWQTILMPGIHYTHLCLASMIRNVYIWYLWYTILKSGIQDTQHLCMDLWCTMPNIHDRQYICLVSMIHNIYIRYS